MWRKGWIAWSAVLAVGLMGCGGSDETAQRPEPGGGKVQSGGGVGGSADGRQTGPAEAVFAFLEAVRTGNDEKAAMMLTQTARRKTAELDLQVAPPGSDTAEFKIGQVEYLAEDGARVASTWSDLDENSQKRTDEILWMLRRDPEGWRVAGMAATVFKGEPPLLLNFEDPQEMIRQQEWLQQEMRRRAQPGNQQAQGAKNPPESIRR